MYLNQNVCLPTDTHPLQLSKLCILKFEPIIVYNNFNKTRNIEHTIININNFMQ